MNEIAATDRDIGYVLEKMSEAILLAPLGSPVRYEIVAKPQNGYPSVSDQINVLTFLYSQKAIRITSLDNTASYIIDFLGGGKGITFEPISPTFDEFRKKYPADKEHRSNEAGYWIVRDKVGNFWFDGNKVHFPNTEAAYVKIFRAVFSLIPNGGTVSYTKIGHVCKADKAAILHALSGKDADLFRSIKSVSYAPKFGIGLFEAVRGKGLIRFNNKR